MPFYKGQKFSEEHRKKLKLARKGLILSDEHKANISKNNARYWSGKKRPPLSEETKVKMSISHKGKKKPLRSEEHRKNMSLAKIGKKMPPRSEEWRRKMSLANKGKSHPYHIGENNPNWKGGITPLINKIRTCLKYKQWRSDIFIRDKYTCQFCNKIGGLIQADHFLKDFSTIFYENKIQSLEQAIECKEFWDLNNGRTLCLPCHKKTDNYAWRGIKKVCVA